MIKLALILILIFIMTSACAYAGVESGIAARPSSCPFSEWVNTESCNKPVEENTEKLLLREQWERSIGIDIFYPYFKAKELESKVKEKTSIKIFEVKGKSEFKDNEAKYTFTIKF